MEKNKKVRLYFMGKRKKDIYLNMTKWEVFKLKVKNTVRSLVIVAMIVGVLCLFYYAGGRSNLAQNAPTTQVKEVLIDNLTPKINELKTAILNEIKICESNGYSEDDGIIVFDPNPRNSKVQPASIGVFMFKKATIVYYWKVLYGEEITGKRAVEIALSETESAGLAHDIIFKTDKGLDNWLNCAKKVGAYKQLEIIKELEK